MKSHTLRARAGAEVSGFTLIELLVVVAVVAVLSVLATPAFRELRATALVRGAASDLMGSLSLARSEALKRNTAVDVVPSASGWAGGWSVTVTVLVAGVSQTLTLEKHGVLEDVSVTPSANGNITFQIDGRNSSGIQMLTIFSPVVSSVNAKCVRLAPSGRIAVTTDTDRNPTNGCG